MVELDCGEDIWYFQTRKPWFNKDADAISILR